MPQVPNPRAGSLSEMMIRSLFTPLVRFRLPALLSLAILGGPGGTFAETYFVDPNGSDTAPGSKIAPFRTIQHAADLAQPGDTVQVAPGIYRERIAPARGGTATSPIVYRSEMPHGAIVSGSDPWRPKWQRRAPGVWSGVLEEALFSDTAHRDGPNPFRIPVSCTPGGREGKPEADRGYPKSDPTLVYSLGQVFVDGGIFEQVPREAEMLKTPGTWFYEPSTGRLTLHFRDDAPERHVVEVTTKRRLFAPHKRQLGHITIEGFVFERCGNQYPANFWETAHPEWQQAGAVGTRSGRNWIIRNNIIRFANGIGVDLGNEGAASVDLEAGDNGKALGASGHLLENNEIVDNGAGGTASYIGANLTIRGNRVERNNRLGFVGKKRWESAGIKLHNPRNSVIEHNLVRDNLGKWGIWCDAGAGENTRIVGNVVINQGVGLDFEIGMAKPAIVANNVFIDNGISIRTRESGGITITHNLILGSKTAGIEYSLDRKREGSWSAAHNAIYNNLLIGGPGLFSKLTAPDDLRSEDRRLDNNVYSAAPNEARYAIDMEPPVDLPRWQARWKSYNGNSDADGLSRAIPGNAYVFRPEAMELELTIAFDPKRCATTPDPRLVEDFYRGQLVAPRQVPGPFESLRSGKQTFKLWP